MSAVFGQITDLSAQDILNRVFIVASNSLRTSAAVPGNTTLPFGSGPDQVLYDKTTSTLANTVIAGVIIGTPVTPSLTAFTLIISNLTASGDLLLAVNNAGNSQAVLKAFGATGLVTLYSAGVPAITIGAASAVNFAGALTEAGVSTMGTDFTMTNSTLTSGQMLNLTLSGSSVVVTAAGVGSIASFVSTATGYSAGTQTLVSITSSGVNTNASTMQGQTISVTNTGAAQNTGLNIVVSGATTNTGINISATTNTHMALNISVGAVVHSSDSVTGIAWSATNSTITTGKMFNMALSGSSAIAPAAGVGSVFTMLVTSTGWTNTAGAVATITVSGANANNGVTVRGKAISVTNTNGASGTNIALQLTASGATTDNIALYITAGVLQLGGTQSTTANQISLGSLGAATVAVFIGNAQITAVSDARVKSKMVDYTADATALLRRLQVVEYDMDERYKPFGGVYDGRYVGLTAQNLFAIAPWTVNTQGGKDCPDCLSGFACGRHGAWQVKQDLLAGLFVKGIQELDGRVTALEGRTA